MGSNDLLTLRFHISFRVGFEPTTDELKVRCSTIELPRI